MPRQGHPNSLSTKKMTVTSHTRDRSSNLIHLYTTCGRRATHVWLVKFHRYVMKGKKSLMKQKRLAILVALVVALVASSFSSFKVNAQDKKLTIAFVNTGSES